jgi:hypothetical protein
LDVRDVKKTARPDSNVIPFPKQPGQGYEIDAPEIKPEPLHGGRQNPLTTLWQWIVAIAVACIVMFGF